MWTDENRALYDRSKLRYPSDLTDTEWALVEPLIPPAKRGGRRRTVDVRAVLNGIFYVLGTGCPSGAAGRLPSLRDRMIGSADHGVRCPRTCHRRARCTTI